MPGDLGGYILAADKEETRMFAQKVNAVLLTKITPESIVIAIEEARTRKVPIFDNGAKALVNEILSL